jgi:hypothetical protein
MAAAVYRRNTTIAPIEVMKGDLPFGKGRADVILYTYIIVEFIPLFADKGTFQLHIQVASFSETAHGDGSFDRPPRGLNLEALPSEGYTRNLTARPEMNAAGTCAVGQQGIQGIPADTEPARVHVMGKGETIRGGYQESPYPGQAFQGQAQAFQEGVAFHADVFPANPVKGIRFFFQYRNPAALEGERYREAKTRQAASDNGYIVCVP